MYLRYQKFMKLLKYKVCSCPTYVEALRRVFILAFEQNKTSIAFRLLNRDFHNLMKQRDCLDMFT